MSKAKNGSDIAKVIANKLTESKIDFKSIEVFCKKGNFEDVHSQMYKADEIIAECPPGYSPLYIKFVLSKGCNIAQEDSIIYTQGRNGNWTLSYPSAGKYPSVANISI